jgi:predicted nucleic acid-binding protein
MKQINDKIFSDSNILVYCYSKSDLKKQNIARTLASTDNVYISTQVLNETANVLHKKYEISWGNLEELMSDCENNFTIHNLIQNDIKQACRIADRYNFSTV